MWGAHFIALDYLRSRGEADRDTLSEVTGHALARLPHGRALWAAGVTVGAVGLWAHIDKYLRE